MNYNLSNERGRLLHRQECKRLEELGKTVTTKPVEDERSSTQSGSRWLYLEMSAIDLNNRGEVYINPLGIEMKFTKELLYYTYWRAFHETMFPDTKRLNVRQFYDVIESVTLFFSTQLFVDVEFPNRNNYEERAKKYKPKNQ